MQQGNAAEFAAVDNYARERLAERGDVYAWAPVEAGDRPRAMLLIAEDADLESFPRSLGGVRIVLKRVSPPQPYARHAPPTAA